MRRFILALPLALTACSTSPMPPPLSSQPPPGITRATDGTEYTTEPSSQSSPRSGPQFFTSGSTMPEVAATMGTPDRISAWTNERTQWNYGFSSVTFINGRVSEWNNAARNLKVKWTAQTAPARLAPSIPTPASGAFPARARPVRQTQYVPAPYFSGGGAYIGGVDGHWIQSKTDDGDIITLEDGSVWKVDAMDVINSALWLPVSNIKVVESAGGTLLINTDDDEKVQAQLLSQ